MVQDHTHYGSVPLAYGKSVWYISITTYSFKSESISSTGCTCATQKNAYRAMLVTDCAAALQGLHTAFLPVLSMCKPFY